MQAIKNSALLSKHRNHWFRITSNKAEWLFVGTYKPPVVNDLEFTNELITILNHFSSKHENLITIFDLNMSIENDHLNTLNLNVQFKCAKKFTYLLAITRSNLHRSHFNK